MPTSPFSDLRDFYDPALVLPVGGREYRIPAPDANETLRLRQYFTDPAATLSDDAHVVELLKILGADLDEATGSITGGPAEEMIANGVSWDELVHVGSTALIHFALGVEAAEAFWTRGNDLFSTPPEPEKPAPAAPIKRAPRKAPAKKAAPKRGAK